MIRVPISLISCPVSGLSIDQCANSVLTKSSSCQFWHQQKIFITCSPFQTTLFLTAILYNFTTVGMHMRSWAAFYSSMFVNVSCCALFRVRRFEHFHDIKAT